MTEWKPGSTWNCGICHASTYGTTGHRVAELLTQASRQIMVEMVAIIFSRLGDLPALDLSAEETHSLAHSPRLAVCHKTGCLTRPLAHLYKGPDAYIATEGINEPQPLCRSLFIWFASSFSNSNCNGFLWYQPGHPLKSFGQATGGFSCVPHAICIAAPQMPDVCRLTGERPRYWEEMGSHQDPCSQKTNALVFTVRDTLYQGWCIQTKGPMPLPHYRVLSGLICAIPVPCAFTGKRRM